MEWYGLRFGRLGSASDIVVAFPLVDGDPDIDAHTDANRIGAYADRTPGSEKVGIVVMGTDAIALFDDRIEIAGNTVWDGGNLISPQETSEKGAVNGYASLDGTGKIPVSQLPSGVVGGLIYQGTWNAFTNTPTLASGVGTQGHYYVVSVAGTTTLDGISDWQVGDWAVFNGTAWEKIDNTDSFTVKADSADPTPGFLDTKVDGTTIQVSASDTLEVIPGGLTIAATQVTVAAGGFTGVLSPADTDVQLAMATIDAHTHTLDGLSDVVYAGGISIPNGVSTPIDSTSTGTAWKWWIVFNNGSGVYTAVEVLAAATGASTIDSTIHPGTAVYPHTITVARAAGTTTLSVTASGTGYTASVRRMTMP
jgi:hypothetical protein